jgi:hypothetical protein
LRCVERRWDVRLMIKRRRWWLLAGVFSSVGLMLAGWLWVDRGVGLGLRRQAREILARYDDDGGAAAPPSAKYLGGVHVESAAVAPGGARLTLGFVADPPGNGPCERDYYAEAFESANAVVVVLEGKPHDLLERFDVSLEPEASCLLIGYSRTATVTLAQPLGSRAVLDGRGGEPVPVTAGR